MVFLDNPTVSSDYIRQMMTTAEQQDIVTKTAMESIIKLLIIVELDRGEKQRLYISQSIKDGIAASNKRSGRKPGQLDKMSDALREDILKYLSDRSIKQVDLMRKYNISRNTLKNIYHYSKHIKPVGINNYRSYFFACLYIRNHVVYIKQELEAPI